MDSTTAASLRTLSRALDQAGDVMAQVRPEQLSASTPCVDWDVSVLLGHLLADARNFTMTLHGEHPDLAAAPEPVGESWTVDFRSAADDLLHAWHERAAENPGPGPDWHTAEFAVHTWDLATAIGVPAAQLDDEVADRALAFMQANLTPERRGSAFGPEQDPTGVGIYDRLVAFAGRSGP